MDNNSVKIKAFIKLQQYNQGREITTSKLKWFSSNHDEIIEFDPDTLKKTHHEHNIFFCDLNKNLSMCPLPNNKFFCYYIICNWSYEHYHSFILEEKNDMQFIKDFSIPGNWWQIESSAFQTFSSLWSFYDCAIYYNNFVYILSRIIIGFDLIKGRWHKLIEGIKDYEWCTCILFNNMILAIEHNKAGIYVIDPAILSISWFSLPIGTDKENLILFSFENKAYLFDVVGKIWESGTNDPFSWEVIREITILWGTLVYENKIFYKNCWYFLGNNDQIYRFNLDQKSIDFNLN